MTEIINLRNVRKQRARQAAVDRAAANRITFGRGNQARRAAMAQGELLRRRHEAHRRDDALTPTGDDQ